MAVKPLRPHLVSFFQSFFPYCLCVFWFLYLIPSQWLTVSHSTAVKKDGIVI